MFTDIAYVNVTICFMAFTTAGTFFHDPLVVDEDVKKPTNQTNKQTSSTIACFFFHIDNDILHTAEALRAISFWSRY